MQHPAERPEPLRLVITMGDPNGVGPEVAMKSAVQFADVRDSKIAIIGAPSVMQHFADDLGFEQPVREVDGWEQVEPGAINVWRPKSLDYKALKLQIGLVEAAAGKAAMQCVEMAVDQCHDGPADAMITAPISKEAIKLAGYTNPGHTEFIANRTGAENFAMMMVAHGLRVALVTGHIAIADVAEAVTQSGIYRKLQVLYESLKWDFGIQQPQIAVLGLNPHAGDGGMMGKEEADVISTAVQDFNADELRAVGPLPADAFFGLRSDKQFDAVLAMYHDQGLVPFKALAFDEGVNFTAGLPIVRTSPDHGTAFDIAGTGEVRMGSMNAALRLAAEVADRRRMQSRREASEE